MSEDSRSQKDSLYSAAIAIVTRTPALVLVLGVVLVILAASDGWREQIRIGDAYWKNAVFFTGVVLIGFAGTLLWRAAAAEQAADVAKRKRASYGVTITTPHETLVTPVKNPGPKAYFEAAGKFRLLPADAQIWVCVVAHDGRRWPHGPAKITGNQDWTVYEVRPGLGPRKDIEVYVVGTDGQALIQQYQRAADQVGKLRERIRKTYPTDDLEIRATPLKDLTSDMVKCAERLVQLADNG